MVLLGVCVGSLQFLPLLLGRAKDSSLPIPPWEILKIPKVLVDVDWQWVSSSGSGWLAGMSRRLVSYQPVKLVSQFCL